MSDAVVALLASVVGAVAGLGGGLIAAVAQRRTADLKRREKVYAAFLAEVAGFVLRHTARAEGQGTTTALEDEVALADVNNRVTLVASGDVERASSEICLYLMSGRLDTDGQEPLVVLLNTCGDAMRAHLRHKNLRMADRVTTL